LAGGGQRGQVIRGRVFRRSPVGPRGTANSVERLSIKKELKITGNGAVERKGSRVVKKGTEGKLVYTIGV